MTSSNIYLLEQGLSLLEQIGDGLYTNVPNGIAKAGIGGHLRHCLDFYDSFLLGVRAGTPGKIDYDRRERNPLIEIDRLIAKAKIESTIATLGKLKLNGQQALLVKLEGEQAQSESAWSDSSITRELQFLLSHTIHHYALIAMLLRLQGYDPPADFGVAPSTLKYWQANA